MHVIYISSKCFLYSDYILFKKIKFFISLCKISIGSLLWNYCVYTESNNLLLLSLTHFKFIRNKLQKLPESKLHFVMIRKWKINHTLLWLDNGTRAQGQAGTGPAADQTSTENPAVWTVDPEVAKTHGSNTSWLRAAAGRAERSARASCKDQLHGKGVTRMGTTADDVKGGPGPCRRSRRYRNERQVIIISIDISL